MRETWVGETRAQRVYEWAVEGSCELIVVIDGFSRNRERI
jgi:hypothetical protein